MRSTTVAGHGLVLAGLLIGSFAIAHENDPKDTAKRIPYEGPSWRSDVDGGVAGGFDSQNVELAANITMSEIDSGQDGNDCWGYTSSSGREYAIMGTTSGTSFIEVTQPGNPQIVGYVDGPNSLWRDVKTFDTYCYAVSEGGSGIQIISLANIDAGVVSLVNTVTTGGGTSTHNVAIDPVRGLLARCGGGSNGLRIYDLASNPTNPPYVGSWSDEYVHDAQIHTMTAGPYFGRTMAFCCGGLNGGSTNTGLDIIDITNPSNPVRIGGTQYSGGAYCHQGWLSEDEQTFYINDELYNGNSSTFIVDVSDLASPQYVTRWTNNNSAICHNLYVKGNRIYEANYRSGLRVVDCSNPFSLNEIGYFDTYPGSDSQSFNGAWSCFPYFDSGTIIVSDIERGLFVFSDDITSVSFSIVGELPNPMPSSGASIQIEISVTGTSLDYGSALAVINDGTGAQNLPMAWQGGETFGVTLPQLECPGTLSISFAVRDIDNELYQSVTYNTAIADGEDIIFYDDGESDLGYAVSGPAGDGQWDLGVPVNCNRGDPSSDGDGTGSCWLTDNSAASSCNSDVDGGQTILTTPLLDATGGEAYVSYDCWYDNTGAGTGADPANDIFVVEISGNGGSSWTTLETVGPSDARSSGGWNRVSFRVADYVTPSTSVQLRFIAEDANSGSVIEAGIDGLSITVVSCDDEGTPGDTNGDGCVNGEDLSIVLGFWGSVGPDGDVNNDGIVDGEDLSIVLGFWSTSCP